MKYSLVTLLGLIVAVVNPAISQNTVVPAATGVSASSVSATSPTTVPGLQQHNPRYQLRKSDSFDVDFAFSPELNQTVAVQPDGYVTLKEVGSIYVEGQTVPELTQTLKDAYAKILHDPVIAISLKDFEKPYFIDSGQVAKPGKYDLRSPLTVIAISLKDFEKPYFIASGQVAKPGKYDLRSDLTVTEAVAIAGGFNEKSKHSQV